MIWKFRQQWMHIQCKVNSRRKETRDHSGNMDKMGDGHESWSLTDPGRELGLYPESSKPPSKGLNQLMGILDYRKAGCELQCREWTGEGKIGGSKTAEKDIIESSSGGWREMNKFGRCESRKNTRILWLESWGEASSKVTDDLLKCSEE